MKARWTLLPILPLALPLAFAACQSGSLTHNGMDNQPVDPAVLNQEQATSASTEDYADAFQASMSVSDTLDNGAGGRGTMFDSNHHAHCTGGGGWQNGCMAVSVLATASVCNFSYPSSVQIVWNCASNYGAAITGSAEIMTTITSNCPSGNGGSGWSGSALTFSYDRKMTIDRTRSKNGRSANLDGTSDLTWSDSGNGGPERQMVYDFARTLSTSGTLVMNDKLTANETVNWVQQTNGMGGNGGGMGGGGNGGGGGFFDNEKVVNGTESVDQLLQNNDFTATQTNLTFAMDCCYPVAGTLALSQTGAVTSSQTITFGPSCGQATNAAGALTLPPCMGW